MSYIRDPRTSRLLRTSSEKAKEIPPARKPRPPIRYYVNTYGEDACKAPGSDFMKRALACSIMDKDTFSINSDVVRIVIHLGEEYWGPPEYRLKMGIHSDLRLAAFYVETPDAPPGGGYAVLCTILQVLLALRKIRPDSIIVLEANYSRGGSNGGLRRYYEKIGMLFIAKDDEANHPEDYGGLMGNTVQKLIENCKWL